MWLGVFLCFGCFFCRLCCVVGFVLGWGVVGVVGGGGGGWGGVGGGGGGGSPQDVAGKVKRQIIFYDKDCGDILLRKIMGGTEMLTLSKLEKIASRSEVLLPSAVSAPSVGTILEVFQEPIFRISHSFSS